MLCIETDSRRVLILANVHAARAARIESAAGRRIYWCRDFAAQGQRRLVPFNGGVGLEDRRQQALRVRMTTVLKQLSDKYIIQILRIGGYYTTDRGAAARNGPCPPVASPPHKGHSDEVSLLTLSPVAWNRRGQPVTRSAYHNFIYSAARQNMTPGAAHVLHAKARSPKELRRVSDTPRDVMSLY